MTIRWLGHSCFLLTTRDGVRIVTDPFDAAVGYPMPAAEAEILTISHSHHDHNHRDWVGGNPIVIESEGNYQAQGVEIDAYPCFHDEAQGAKRGRNLIFVFQAEGLRMCHAGDLGHPLGQPLLRQIGLVDVLMVPVGGVYTLDAAGAWELVRRMEPRAVIPMHYKTPPLSFDLAPAGDFLALTGQSAEPALSELVVEADRLSRLPPVVVLDWRNR